MVLVEQDIFFDTGDENRQPEPEFVVFGEDRVPAHLLGTYLGDLATAGELNAIGHLFTDDQDFKRAKDSAHFTGHMKELRDRRCDQVILLLVAESDNERAL